MREAERVPDFLLLALNLVLAADIAVRLEQPAHAAHLVGAAQAIFTRQEPSMLAEASLDVLLPGWRERSDHEAIQQELEFGQAMTNHQALAYGLNPMSPK
jgi:hypothetical protein